MAIDEASRHRLHRKLEALLGSEEAATLMEHLPPVGWADVATKRDLDHLRAELIATLHAELNAQQRHFVSIVVGANAALSVTIAGLAFAAAKLV